MHFTCSFHEISWSKQPVTRVLHIFRYDRKCAPPLKTCRVLFWSLLINTHAQICCGPIKNKTKKPFSLICSVNMTNVLHICRYDRKCPPSLKTCRVLFWSLLINTHAQICCRPIKNKTEKPFSLIGSVNMTRVLHICRYDRKCPPPQAILDLIKWVSSLTNKFVVGLLKTK